MDIAELNKRIANGESFLIANDGQFLGKLTLSRYDNESIMNPYGLYGSKYSATSIFSRYANYGSPYSSLSPFNKYTSTPPTIYLKGRKYGYLSKNKYLSSTILDPDGLLDWLTYNNLRY